MNAPSPDLIQDAAIAAQAADPNQKPTADSASGVVDLVGGVADIALSGAGQVAGEAIGAAVEVTGTVVSGAFEIMGSIIGGIFEL